MSPLIPKETSTLNANGSRIFAIIIAFLYVLSVVVGVLKHFYADTSFLIFSIIAGIVMVIVALANVENTFETNDDWKTWAGIGSCIFSFLLIAIPFANLNGG